MDMIALQASPRDAKAKANQLRRLGWIPGVVYGQKTQLSVQCKAADLHQAFAKAGESAIVELAVEGKKIPVLFKEVTLDPISDREIHADFYAVDMSKHIETLVPIHCEGEPPAVKTLGGVFVIVHDHVRVRCLPADLPHQLVVNVAGLEQFHTSVSVADLQIPKGVKVMEEATTVIATVQEPRKEEEIVVAAPTPAEGEAAAVEGAPAAEGEAAAPTAEAQTKEKAEKEEKGKKEKK